MKEILLLLLLDYSGSMYQTFENKVKYKTVQYNVTGLLSSADKNEEIVTVIFGSKPENKCNDIILKKSTVKNFSSEFLTVLPGPFGQTPLSDALSKAIQLTIKMNIKQLVAITDGADSCQKDPCQTLIAANEVLIKANKSINLILIGFDINSNPQSFECFKKLKLSNIKLDFVSANNNFELQKKLNELSQKIADAQIKQNQKNISESNSNKNSNMSSRKGKNAQSKSKLNNDKSPTLSKLEVKGAPADSEFTLINLKTGEVQKWNGSFPQTLGDGDYELKSNLPGTKKVLFKITYPEKVNLKWADFFAEPLVSFDIQKNLLTYEFIPSEQTKLVHNLTENIIVFGELDNHLVNKKIPFGHWTIKITSPPWLKDAINPVDIFVDEKQKINFDDSFKDKIIWVKNVKPEIKNVIEINLNDHVERHFIQQNIQQVPLHRDSKFKFIL